MTVDPDLLVGTGLAPGRRLGRYQLIAPIGRGGMAVVWAARASGSHGFSKLVAVKTILPALRETIDLEGRRRLLELAEATASRRLRIALQAVAADRDDEALAEALAAAETAKAEPSRPRSTRRA